MNRFLFAGDAIATDLDLELAEPPLDVATDVTIEVRTAEVLDVPEFDEVLHQGEMGGATWGLGTLPGGTGHVMRLGAGCFGTISPDLAQISLTSLPEAPGEWMAEATTGWALVYRLALAARPTFHASAFTIDGSTATAISGAGFAGKSSLAAAAIAEGGSLLSDDVLALRCTPAACTVSGTATSVKLRGAAQDFGSQNPTATTFDGRVRLDVAALTDDVTLSRIYFLDDGDGIRPLPATDVVMRLIQNSKVGSWTWDAAIDREFELACNVADRVEGFALGRIPNATSDQLRDLAATLVSH